MSRATSERGEIGLTAQMSTHSLCASSNRVEISFNGKEKKRYRGKFPVACVGLIGGRTATATASLLDVAQKDILGGWSESDYWLCWPIRNPSKFKCAKNHAQRSFGNGLYFEHMFTLASFCSRIKIAIVNICLQ